MPLNLIDYKNENFKEELFHEFTTNRGAILTGLGQGFSECVNNVFKAFDAFRHAPESEKEPFIGKKDGFHGYFKPEAYHYGGKTTERFFISRNAEKQLVGPLPEFNHSTPNFDASSRELTDRIQEIAWQVVESIEGGLAIGKNKLKNLLNPSSLLTISHYLPTTKELLNHMLQHKKLTETTDGEIKSFEEHKDLSLFSMLIYRNNEANGLKIKLKDAHGIMRFESVELPKETKDEIYLIVVVGSMLQELSNKQLKGLTHTVVTKPLAENEIFSRECIATFMSHDPSLKFNSIIDEDDSHVNFMALFNKRYEEYEKSIQENALKELPPCAKDFPLEKEIQRIETDNGTVYVRQGANT